LENAKPLYSLKNMLLEDMKTYALNLTAFAVSFTNIDVVLKIILLLITIGFTIDKWYQMRKEKSKK